MYTPYLTLTPAPLLELAVDDTLTRVLVLEGVTFTTEQVAALPDSPLRTNLLGALAGHSAPLLNLARMTTDAHAFGSVIRELRALPPAPARTVWTEFELIGDDHDDTWTADVMVLDHATGTVEAHVQRTSLAPESPAVDRWRYARRVRELAQTTDPERAAETATWWTSTDLAAWAGSDPERSAPTTRPHVATLRTADGALERTVDVDAWLAQLDTPPARLERSGHLDDGATQDLLTHLRAHGTAWQRRHATDVITHSAALAAMPAPHHHRAGVDVALSTYATR